MNRIIALLALPLAACASTGDYPGAKPAPVAYTAPIALEQPTQVDNFAVVQTPQTQWLTPGVVTTPRPGDTVWRPLSAGGTLQPYQPYRPFNLN